MKNILLTGGMLLWSSIATFANPVTKHHPHVRGTASPTYQTEQNFEIDFPGALHVTWYNKENEEATFMYNGQQIRAYYDNDNKLIGTVTDASYSALPAVAVKEIEKHYRGYTPQEVVLFDDNEYNDSPLNIYGSPFDEEDNYFVKMEKGDKTIVLQFGLRGDVSFFKELK